VVSRLQYRLTFKTTPESGPEDPSAKVLGRPYGGRRDEPEERVDVEDEILADGSNFMTVSFPSSRPLSVISTHVGSP
jgi:hypothetical protein